MKNKKIVIIVALIAIVSIVGCFFAFNKEADETITCYTMETKAHGELPEAQESRQFLIEDKKNLEAFEEAYNIDFAEVIDKNIVKDKSLLIMLSNEVVKCKLTSVFIDDNKQPHMMVEKIDDNSNYRTCVFVASVDKSYTKKLDLSRWTKY